MTAPAFTPGPWELRGLTVFEVGKTGISVAVATQHETNAKANARLIAAAPELYEALTEAVKTNPQEEWIALLAKARGEQ
jgi:hypothetical protein